MKTKTEYILITPADQGNPVYTDFQKALARWSEATKVVPTIQLIKEVSTIEQTNVTPLKAGLIKYAQKVKVLQDALKVVRSLEADALADRRPQDEAFYNVQANDLGIALDRYTRSCLKKVGMNEKEFSNACAFINDGARYNTEGVKI